MQILTLTEFYDLMFQTKQTRIAAIQSIVENGKADSSCSAQLKDYLAALEGIEEKNKKKILALDSRSRITLDLTYEIEELKKDIVYCEQGEKAFNNYLNSIHLRYKQIIADGLHFLKKAPFNAFITDRDGTVNNYCGRYASSIQSIYNAMFLARFAEKGAKNSIILTSAPLDNIGLVDLSIIPANLYIYAGSKGREYFNKDNKRCQLAIDQAKQLKLDTLNQKLSALIKDLKYNKFSLIGSGLQFKFGQTTIARQDISETIPENESMEFYQLIESIVKEIDVDDNTFRLEDTGKDIEILLTVDNESSTKESKDFDKGDGVNYLNDDLNLELEIGPNLICGDTNSDVPMIEAASKMRPNPYSIFVTKDEKLKEKVKQLTKNAFFVDEPDMLVGILNSFLR